MPAMNVLDSLSNSTLKKVHDGAITLKLNDTPIKSIEIMFGGMLSDGTGNSFHGNFTSMSGIQDSRIHQYSGSKISDYAVRSSIGWTDNDTKKWRPFVSVGAILSNNTSLNWTVDTLNTSYLKRHLSSNGYGSGVDAHMQAGTEATLTNSQQKTSKLQVCINSNYQFRKRRQLSMDEYGVDIPVMDMANSFDFTTNQFKLSLDTRFEHSMSSGKTMWISTSLMNVSLFDSERLPASFDNSKHFPSIGARMRYSSREMIFEASSTTIIPSVEQVRNRVSNISPTALSAGNPNIRQGYNIQFTTLFSPLWSQNRTGTTSRLEASVGGAITFRPIVAKVRYFEKQTTLDEYDGYCAGAGSILNTFDNSPSPRINMRGQSSFSQSFKGSQFSYKISLNDDYLHSPMYNGESLSYLDENNANISLNLNYKPSTVLRVNNVTSSGFLVSYSRGDLLSARFILRDNFRVRWFITKRIKFDTDYTFSCYNYVAGSGRDFMNHFLNVGLTTIIGRSFEIALWGYDILNSGSLYSVDVNSAMMSQTWTPTYGRNIMLQLAYRFRKKN